MSLTILFKEGELTVRLNRTGFPEVKLPVIGEHYFTLSRLLHQNLWEAVMR